MKAISSEAARFFFKQEMSTKMKQNHISTARIENSTFAFISP